MPNPGKLIPNYVAASVALSFAGILNGLDTGAIGAIVHMDQFTDTFGLLSPSTVGWTVSIVMLTGIVPALLGGQVADRKGRLYVVFPGAVLFALGAILQMSAFSLGQFITGRAIAGAGQGAFYSNISVYITEIAPQRSRGRLASLPQFMAALGVCLGYFGCFCTASVESSMAWRLPYILQICVALMLALVCRSLPESPRWLVLHGRGEEAVQAVRLLNFNMDEATRDFLTPQPQENLSSWQSFRTLFRRAYLPRTLLSLFILSMAQLSGIDAINYYAPTLFVQTGIATTKTSIIAAGVAAVAMFIASIPGFVCIDKWGRRTCTLVGGSILCGIMLLIGSLYAAGAVLETGAARWVVVVSVFLFGIVFCATWGIVSKIYASEIQPSHTRAAGNSVGMAFSFFTNWFVSFITPILLSSSAYNAYFFFGALNLFGVAVFALYMPETRGRSLEQIQSDFAGPNLSALRNLFSRHVARSASASPQDGRSSASSIELTDREPATAATAGITPASHASTIQLTSSAVRGASLSLA